LYKWQRATSKEQEISEQGTDAVTKGVCVCVCITFKTLPHHSPV